MKTLVLLLCCLSIGLGSELVGGSPASGAPTQWSSTKSPKDNGEISLVGVSCVQSDWCMAAGRVHGGRTLFESWSGSAWTLVPSPKPPGHPTYLQGVSCTSSQFCVAAGYDFGRNGTRAAIETWNGIAWSVTHSPKVASAYLYGVSPRARRSAWRWVVPLSDPRNRTPRSSSRGMGAPGRSTRARMKRTATTWRECPARVRRTVWPLVGPAPTQEVPRASS